MSGKELKAKTKAETKAKCCLPIWFSRLAQLVDVYNPKLPFQKWNHSQ